MKRIATFLILVFWVVQTPKIFAQTTISTGKYTTGATLDTDANIYALQYDEPNDEYDVVKYDAPGYSSSTVLYDGVEFDGDYPTDIEIASNGDVYFLDGFDSAEVIMGRLIVLDASNSYSSTVIASGDYYTSLGIDSNDDIFVAQYDGSSTYEVVKYDVSNSYNTSDIYSGLGLNSPYSRGLTIDPDGNIYVLTNFELDGADGKIIKLTAPGYSSSVLDQGEYYSGLAIDGNGDLFATAYDATNDHYDVVKYTGGAGSPSVLRNGLTYNGSSYPTGIGSNRNLGDLVVPDPWASGDGALYYYDRTPPPAPMANIPGGTYNSDQAVTLSGESGASIYYTLDGSTPTTGSMSYTSPITISSTTTLQAIAMDGAGNESDVLNETYTLDTEAPVTALLDGDTVDLKTGGPAMGIDQGGNVTVTDPDSPHFNSGVLEITDRGDNNTANGNFSVDGVNVTSGGDGAIAAGETISVGGTAIGTIHATDDGQGGNTLTINFNTTDATPGRAQTLIQNIAWTAPSGDGNQTFELRLADRAGNSRTPDQFTMTLSSIGPDASGILYVDQDASGEETGDSWADALPTLTEALAYARDEWTPTNGPLQIWIADGTYKPTDGTDRSASFRLTGAKDGVEIYGGFAGNESDLSQRDPATNVVTLSGDLNGDDSDGDGDGFPETNRTDNSYHVVKLEGNAASGPNGGHITHATIIDGVTISGGNANDANFPDNSGGGLLCIGQSSGNACSPTIQNVTFTGNSALKLGGGLYNLGSFSGQSSPEITNAVFSYNRAASGGGIFNDGGSNGSSNPVLTEVTFRGNQSLFDGADGNGAGLFNNGSGGQSSPVIVNATFAGNHAERDGGAIFNDGRSDGTSDPQIVNTVFTGNSSDSNGGGVYSIGGGSSGQSSPVIVNATFTGNTAIADGGGLVNDVVNAGSVGTTLQNTILYGNSAGNGGQQIYNRGAGAMPTLSYTLVEAGTGGITNSSSSSTTYTDGSGSGVSFENSTNIAADPMFIDASDPDGTDNEFATSDDGLALTAASEAVNAGDPDTDLALFPNGPASPLDIIGASRIYNGATDRIDIGAYELQAEQDINEAPSFTSSPVTEAQENASYSYQITTQDPDGDGLTITSVQIPDWATLTDNGDGTGTLEGTPAFDDSGDYTVELQVSDGDLSETQSFTITVDNTNRAPAFDSSPVTSAKEGESYSYNIEASDSDGDGLTITSVQIPGWATLTDNGDGTASLEGTPGPEEAGDVAIELTVSDGTATTTQSFTITVDNTNRTPSFDSTPVTSAKEGEVYSYAIEVSDPDGDGLSISGIQIPDWASLQDNNDGTATLSGTPGPDDMGDAPVELEVSDGTATATQLFTITVDNTNRAPSFDSSPVTSAKEGDTYSYAIEASDPDEDELSFSAVQIPAWASLQDNNDGTATLSGTPGPNDMGDAPVELEVSDGTATATQSFTITVDNTNRPPVFDSAPVTKVQEQKPYSYTIAASDPDGDELTLTAPTIPSWATFADNGDGTAILNGTPDADDIGDYPVELVVSDGSLSDNQAFTISVADTNRAPGVTSSPVTEAKEGQAYSYTIEASDPDGDALEFSAETLPDWASLSANSSTSATLEGTPGFDAAGSYTIELIVSDGGLQQTQEFELSIADSNRTPSVTSEPITQAREGQAYSYTIETQDPDGDERSITALNIPEWASFTDHGDGTAILEGTPGPDDMDDAPVELEVSDGTDTASQSFTITVDNTNRAPVFDSDPVTGAKEGEAYSYAVQASDPDGEEVSMVAPTTPDWASFTDHGDGTGTLEGTPGFEAEGRYAMELVVSDGSADTTQKFEITVGGANRPPVFTSEAVTSAQETQPYTYTVIASDPDGDGLEFSAGNIPDWASLTAVSDTSATLEGTPGAEASGDFPVELAVSDGKLSATQSFTITVGNTNRPPVFDSDPVTEAKEGEAYSYAVQASDPDGDGLSIAASTIPDWLTLTDGGDGTAMLEGTPGPDDMGDVSVELEVTDGTDTVTQKFTITVARTNQKPDILSQPSLQVPSEMAYRYVVAAIDTAGSDTGGKLTFGAELESGAPLPGWLSWEEVPDEGPLRRKALVGRPPVSAMGTYAIVVSVSDEGNPPLATDQRFTLRVTQGNRGPTIGSSPVEVVRMNNAYSYTITAEDPDADKVDFSASLSGGEELPDWLSLQASSDTTATLAGEPKEKDIGTYDIEVLAVDNGTPQKQTTQAFTLEVKYKEVEELKALYNYPNPFQDATKIKFELPEEAEVYMQLYNLTGALVRQTAPKVFKPGANEFDMRARNLASGIYIYRIVSGSRAVTGKITLIR